MFENFRLGLIFPIFILFIGLVNAQENRFTHLPSIAPTYVQEIGVDEGLPGPCFDYVWLDDKGRMWLQPCTSSQSSYSIYLASFDGKNTQSYSLSEHKATRSSESAIFKLAGTSEGGFYFGTYISGQRSFLMFSNPEKDSVAIVGLEGSYSEGGEWLQEAFSSEGRVMVITVEDELTRLYSYSRDNLTELFSWTISDFPVAIHSHNQLSYAGETKDDWWFMRRVSYPFKVNKQTGEVTEFGKSNFPTNFSLDREAIRYFNRYHSLGEVDGHLIIANSFAETFRYHPEQKTFEKFRYLPYGLVDSVGIVHAFWTYKDSVGNTLHSLVTETGRYSLLRDKEGKWFNYSEATGNHSILDVYGQNFKRKAYLATPIGIRAIEFAQDNYTFQTFPDFIGCRGIVQEDEHNFLVQSVFQTYRLNVLNDSAALMPSCIDKNGFNNLLIDNEGYYWMVSSDLIRFDPRTEVCSNAGLDNPGNRIVWLDDKKEELLIIGAGKPFISYNIKTKRKKVIKSDWENIFDHQINHTLADSRGKVWIATGFGLYKYDPETTKVTKYAIEQGFPDYRMVHIFERDDGLLWIGTFSQGIVEFDPIRDVVIRSISDDDGLSNNTVVSILQDNDNFYWVATYYGLNILSSQGDVLASYEAQDGLTNNEFNRLSALKTKEGKLMFGTIRGFNLIDPIRQKEALFANEPLRIFASDIRTFNSDDEARILSTEFIETQKPIILRPGDKSLKLSFGLSNYLNTDKNRYSYRVIGGSDESWLSPENQAIKLSNLRSGKYKIEVMGKDFQGRQCVQSLVVPLIVKRNFYQQSWFYALIGLLTLSIIGGYILQLRGRNLALNKEVAIRTAQSQEDKRLIEKQSAVLFNLGEDKEVVKAQLPTNNLIEKIESKDLNTNPDSDEKIGGLIEELLNLSQTDTQQISNSPTVILKFTKERFESFRPQARLKDISYSLHSGIHEQLKISLDIEMYKKVLDSLLNNALEISPKSGQVYVSLSNSENWLLVKVRDSGNSIEAADIPHLFDRYFHTSKSTEMGVAGIGLALASEVAKLMGGNIEVESIAGKGNIFHFRLPLGNKRQQTTQN